MQNVALPKFDIIAKEFDREAANKNISQIAQDSLNAYLGIRGLGNVKTGPGAPIISSRRFQALFHLAYWDIYKNYYSNKQEEVGYVIGNKDVTKEYPYELNELAIVPEPTGLNIENLIENEGKYTLTLSNAAAGMITEFKVFIPVQFEEEPDLEKVTVTTNASLTDGSGQTSSKLQFTEGVGYELVIETTGTTWEQGAGKNIDFTLSVTETTSEIDLVQFPLENIDKMREKILATGAGQELIISQANEGRVSPYKENYELDGNGNNITSHTMAGLGIKTYLSDRFNNWLSTEWIDGAGGINEITAVDVSDGKLTMDSLILQKKIYNMLNRIAISGGTYNDWQEAVFGVEAKGIPESPIYCGGYASEIVFDEVVSNSASETSQGSQPLGSLAGRGSDRFNRGGNNIEIKCDEPSLIMVIGSITPRIDYSQGNKWWTRLETMDDFHKPELDQIGFQELITDEMCASDTTLGYNSNTYKSIGKQPSWIEYMTDVNECYGDFTFGNPLDFMAFNRGYETDEDGTITDATTYIDPTKFNVAFADAKLTAKNVWVQVSIDCKARRVMSAKQIPNL